MEEAKTIAEKNNYTLDYLESGSPIFQVKNFYMFTSDSVRLASFVKETDITVLVDFCSGSGIVGLEVVERANVEKLFMFEVQEELFNASEASAKLNNRNTKIYPNLLSVQKAYTVITDADVVVCNPPFFKAGSGGVSTNNSKLLARHEVMLTLEEIFVAAKKVLKIGGKFYLLHITQREKEIENLAKKYGFTINEKLTLEGHLKRTIFALKSE